MTNLLRLLNLAKAVQDLLMQGKLDMGHARALLAVSPARQAEVAHQIITQGLSVRETEQLRRAADIGSRKGPRKQSKDRDLQALEEELSELLGTAITINTSRGRARASWSSAMAASTSSTTSWPGFAGRVDRHPI